MENLTREQALELIGGGQEGIEEWNAYRETGGTVPNLSKADLREADLRGANLSGTDLSGANLSGADLSAAELYEANLSRANLNGAHLGRADLVRANLRETNLSGADLWRANLSDADLSASCFNYAKVWGTIFAGDVSRARDLEHVIHGAPSTVGPSSFLNFSDKLPEKFLRGVGYPDFLIDALRANLGAILFYSCFISYSSIDEEFAKRLHADLQDNGVRCWFAPEDMKIGDRPMREVNEQIRLRDKLVIILSEASIKSDWVEHEVTKALEEEKRRGEDILFPIRIDDAVMKSSFGWAKRIRVANEPTGRHIGDFAGWMDHTSYQGAFKGFLADLREKS